MATDSFTSSATVTTAATSATAKDSAATAVFTRQNFFKISAAKNNVVVTKATSFGGSQSALTFPLTRDAALELATELLKIVT